MVKSFLFNNKKNCGKNEVRRYAHNYKLFIIGFKCVDEASGGRKGKERDSLTTGETDRKRERERNRETDRQPKTAIGGKRKKEKKLTSEKGIDTCVEREVTTHTSGCCAVLNTKNAF